MIEFTVVGNYTGDYLHRCARDRRHAEELVAEYCRDGLFTGYIGLTEHEIRSIRFQKQANRTYYALEEEAYACAEQSIYQCAPDDEFRFCACTADAADTLATACDLTYTL